MPIVQHLKDEHDEEALEDLKEAIRQKRYELERRRNDHEKEKDQRRREVRKYTADHELLCRFIRDNGLNLEIALNNESPSDLAKKRIIHDLKKRANAARIQFQNCMDELKEKRHDLQQIVKRFELLKSIFTATGTNYRWFRYKSIEYGLSFTIDSNGIFQPALTDKDYKEHQKILKIIIEKTINSV